MDGLTISNSENLLKTGRTNTQIRNDDINSQAVNDPKGEFKSFATTLSDAVNKVNEISTEADTQMQKLATGKTKNIPEVLIATEKANVAFKLLTQVRNKIIEAYQEVMKMQV